MKKFVSLRIKMIYLLAISIVIPFIASNIIIYKEIKNRIERNTEQYVDQLLHQVKSNLEYYIKEMDRLTMAPFYDEELLKILKNHSEIKKPSGIVFLTSEESAKMSFFISSLNYEGSDIGSIRLFTNDGMIYNNYEYSKDNKWTLEDSPWIKQVTEAKGELVIILPHMPTYFTQESKTIISIARSIIEPYTSNHLGIMKIDITENGLREILYPADVIYENQFYIFNRVGNQVFPIENKIIPPGVSGRTVVGGEESYVLHTTSEYTGLQIYSVAPYDIITKDAREITTATISISIISILTVYCLSVWFSNRLIYPLRKLKDKIKEVGKGDFNVNLNIRSNDEIGEVADVFNRMIGEINRLVKEVYEVRLQERESEIIALQSQINPHFLYNTLETINMMAVRSRQIEISDVVATLGKLLHYTVSKQEKPVKLKSEIMFVKNYLSIQALRKKDKFSTEIIIDSALEDCLVPKLILQPFIENIIEHAIKEDPVRIRIKSEIQWNDLIIIVQDNGVGFGEEKTREIEERMYSKKGNFESTEQFGRIRKGYALRNVHQRIFLLYGEPYGVYVDRTAENGTTFILRLPLIWEASDEI